MITKLFNFILESSSLTRLGVPSEVMIDVQKNYEIPSDCQWEQIRFKKDLKTELKKDEKSIFIEISKESIRIFTNTHNSYTEQKYKYDDSGWGGYTIGETIYPSFSSLIGKVSASSQIYKCDNDNFKLDKRVDRQVQKNLKDFDNVTQDFKIGIIRNFNNILTRIYGKKHKEVLDKISKNMSSMDPNMDTDEMLKFLTDNKQLAEIAKEYQDAKNDDDKYRLKSLEKQYNSLTIFNEFLINFEVAYSDKYNYRITLYDMIKSFGLMQVQTSFLYYLYTNKIKDMKISKFESYSQEYNDPEDYSRKPKPNMKEPAEPIVNFDKLVTGIKRPVGDIDREMAEEPLDPEEDYVKKKPNWRWS